MSWESNPYTLADKAKHCTHTTDKPPVGFEPTIYRLEVCRLIHWATGAVNIYKPHAGLEPATLRLRV